MSSELQTFITSIIHCFTCKFLLLIIECLEKQDCEGWMETKSTSHQTHHVELYSSEFYESSQICVSFSNPSAGECVGCGVTCQPPWCGAGLWFVSVCILYTLLSNCWWGFVECFRPPLVQATFSGAVKQERLQIRSRRKWCDITRVDYCFMYEQRMWVLSLWNTSAGRPDVAEYALAPSFSAHYYLCFHAALAVIHQPVIN